MRELKYLGDVAGGVCLCCSLLLVFFLSFTERPACLFAEETKCIYRHYEALSQVLV